MPNRNARRGRVAVVLITCTAAIAMLGAAGVSAETGSRSSGRASIVLKPGSIRAGDIGSRSILPRHLALSTMPRLIGSGTTAQRPRATRATSGWLYFAEDADGGALFRSNGRGWDQLTTGRLGKIARNSLDSSRIKPSGINGSRLADNAVTSRAMSMDAWRAISTSGTLGSRPGAGERPAGSLYFATDVLGGTLYQNDGFNWARVSSLGAEANITPGSITGAMIADGAITGADLAAGSITATQIAAGAVGSSELADGSVTLADIDPAVWADRLGSGTLALRPAAAASNANSLYLATDDAGGTLARSDGAAWQVVGRSRSPRTVNFMFGIWSNMPAALSEMYGANRSRVPMDLSTATEARMSTNVLTVGFASGSICMHYSTDNGFTWYNFDGSFGTNCVAGVVQVPVNALGLQISPWTTIPAAAQTENTIIRATTFGGNNALDPNFGVTALEVR
jgi:hypothetical protein